MVRVTQCTPRSMYGTCHSMHPEEDVWYVSLNAPRGGCMVRVTQCTPRSMYGTCHSMHPEEDVWYVSLNAPRGVCMVRDVSLNAPRGGCMVRVPMHPEEDESLNAPRGVCMVRVTQCTPRRMYGTCHSMHPEEDVWYVMYGTCHSMHPEEDVWYVSLNAPRGGCMVRVTQCTLRRWLSGSNMGYTVKPRLSEQLCSQNSVLCSDK